MNIARTRATRIARRPKARVALLLFALALVGCPGDGPHKGPDEAPPARVNVARADSARADADARSRIDLLDLFEVALVRGLNKEGESAEHGDVGDEPVLPVLPVLQRAGSAVTFHVVLPAGAQLTARGTLRGDAGAQARLRITLTASRVAVTAGVPDSEEQGAGEQRAIAVETLVASPRGVPVALDVDLAADAGRMARVEIAVEAPPGPQPDSVEIAWSELAIDGAPPEPQPVWEQRGRYNVLLVVFDSLRADHIEPYGAENARTPNLTRLAREGVTFVNARSSASWTRPSVAAMLTSLEPDQTGVLTFEDPLPKRVPYLPEILREAGYHTLAITNNAMISPIYGFGRGFVRMREIFLPGGLGTRATSPETSALSVWSAFVKRIAKAKRPFFIYMHAIEPHSPYDAPEPYGSLDDFGYARAIDTTDASMRRIRHHPEEFDAEDIREIHRRYRAEIAYLDVYLGTLLDLLAKAGLERETVVVVASDHGEEFRDHGGIGHGHTLYEELLRVPLILRLPGVLPAGARVRTPANLVDLPATLLDLLGVEAPKAIAGTSLLPQVANPDAALAPRPGFGRTYFDAESVVVGRWKLIRTPQNEATPRALYDVEGDPSETRNVADAHPIVVETLEQMLRSKRRQSALRDVSNDPPIPIEDVAPGVRENLRALGYIE